MSYKVKCTGCSYVGSFLFNVQYEYEQGDNCDCSPHLAFGWCRGCEAIVKVCGPETDLTIKEIVDEFNQQISNERQKWQWIFFRMKTKRFVELLAEIKKLQECAEFYKRNTFKPKCLTCGSEDVVYTKMPGRSRSDWTELAVDHACGGKLIAAGGLIYFYNSLPRVVYDAYGNILTDER